MNLAEEWRLSRVSYAELVYRPLLRSGFTLRDSGSPRSVMNALRGATVNKLIFALFTMVGAVFPFVLYRLGHESVTEKIAITLRIAVPLRVAVSLSVLLVFGYIILYAIQILPSFVSSGSFTPLADLPLTTSETSAVAALTLWRTLDVILGLSLATQFLAVLYFTGSTAAALVVFLATGAGSLLAVSAALWLTSVFHRRLESGRMTGLRGLFRPLLFVVWGLGVMSAVFIFNLVTYIAPALNSLLSDPSSSAGAAASLVFPFSAGLLVSSLTGEVVTRISVGLSIAGIAFALLGCVGALSGASRMIAGVVLPTPQGSAGTTGVDYSFPVRNPLSAYVLKDVRVASRNPATGFLFALPIFEIFAVVIPLTGTPIVRVAAILAGAQVGGGFALFIAFLLVTVEDMGVERRTALPLSEAVRTLSKAVVSLASYLPVPLALTAILLTKASTFGGAVLIPFVIMGSVGAACVVEVLVLRLLSERGWGAAGRFAIGIGSGEAVLVLPAVIYTFEFLLYGSHQLSLDMLTASVAVELAVAILILSRLVSTRRSGREELRRGALEVSRNA